MTAIEPEKMPRRRVLLGGAFLAASVGALARTPKVVNPPVDLPKLEKMVPLAIGDWRFETSSGLVLPPADPALEKLYNGVLTRVYVAEKEPPIMLLMAYSNKQDGMLQLHRPEVCYPATGYTIVDPAETVLNGGSGLRVPAMQMTATGRDRIEQIVYWTRIDAEYPRRWIEQRMAVARSNLRGIVPDGILVRASLLSPEMQDARPILERFFRALSESLDPKARNLIIGQGSAG